MSSKGVLNRISKSQYAFFEIFSWFDEKERLRYGQLSKKFYGKIIPFLMEKCSIISTAGHLRHQQSLYQY